MIVRDEAHHITDCLTSLAGVVDEIIVVDTGSSDGTPELACERGASVSHEPWRDDFAAARNKALELCSGEWVLYIDADERVRSGTGAGLHDLLDDSALGACFVGLVAKSGFRPYREMRLFRADPRVRFRGVIHENIWPALIPYLSATGRRIAQSELVLDHVGYEGDQSHKHRRNLPLLLRALEVDPDHVYCWTHLASIRRDSDDVCGAREALMAGVAAARRQPRGPSQNAGAFLGLADLERAEGGDARPILDELLRLFPDNAQGLFQRAQLNLDEGRVEAAEADFRALAAWPDSAAEATNSFGYLEGLFDATAFEGLGACCWRQGRHAEAADWFARAHACAPERAELGYKEAFCRGLAGRSADASA